MYRVFTGLASIVLVFSLLATFSYAQLGEYAFDAGGDGSSWDDAANWDVILNPDGTPAGGGNPGSPPDPITNASIAMLGVMIDSTMPGQTAKNVNIGMASGAGSLMLSGTGGLTVSTDFNVGSSTNAGIFIMTGGTLDAGDDIDVGKGSVGTMVMIGGTASAGDDFFIRNTSSFNMLGGTVNIGDRLILEDNASLTLSGADIIADDDFFFFGDSQVTLNGSSMVVKDKLRFDSDDTKNGKLTINGGFVRSDEYHFDIADPLTDFRGVVEINGDGFYDVQNKAGPLSNLDVATAELLIDQGIHFITSEALPLHAIAITLGVGEFFGNTEPLSFTRILVVPEPGSVLLLGLGSLGLLLRRKRAR